MTPAHQHGEYPATWPELAKAVKHEAGGACVRCWETHDPSSGHTLTVHHFDGDRGNSERWNLMALCQRCHLSIQARVNPAVGLLTDPSVWILPYLAGLYESGQGIPGPTYNLERWRCLYETGETLRLWPPWAPTPMGPI